MAEKNRFTIVIAAAGAVFGGLFWVVIMEIALRSWFHALIPVFLGGLCIFGVIKLYNRRPERKLAIIGLAILWLVVINFIFINVLYDSVPNILWGVSTGKNQISLYMLNLYMGIFSLAGFIFVIADILGRKRK